MTDERPDASERRRTTRREARAREGEGDEQEARARRRLAYRLKVGTAELRATYDRELQQLTRHLRERRGAASRLGRRDVEHAAEAVHVEDVAQVEHVERTAHFARIADAADVGNAADAADAEDAGMLCPAPAALLAVRDGGGDPAEDARVLLHVEACPHCSRFLWITDELLLGSDADLDAATSSPFVDLDTNARQRLFGDREWPFERPSHAIVRRWFPFVSPAVAALLIAVLTLHTTSVTLRADVLLEQAIRQERAREDEVAPVRARMRWMPNVVAFGREERPPAEYGPVGELREIEIETDTETDAAPPALSTATRATTSAATSASILETNAPNDKLGQLLAFHQFDLRHPFSVRRFQAWRANLPQKADHMSVTGDLRMLRVTTPNGQLRTAEITFRTATMEVVRIALVFDGLGRLEIHAADRQPEPLRRAPRAPAPLEAAKRAAPRPAELAALQEVELDIRLLLRQHNLDLDGAVRVARVDSELRVTLPSTPAAHVLRPALEALSPRVRITWLDAGRGIGIVGSAGRGAGYGAESPAEPSASGAPRAPGMRSPSGPSNPPSPSNPSDMAGASSSPTDVRIKDIALRQTRAEDGLRPWMARWQERYFAKVPDERASFSTRLLDRSRDAERHVTLLKALSARYSSREVDTLTPLAYQKLQQLVTLQHRALTQTLQQLSYRLATLGDSTLVSPHLACSPRIAESSWRRIASRAPDRALALHRSIARLVQATRPPLDADGQCDLTEIDRELVALWTAINSARTCGE